MAGHHFPSLSYVEPDYPVFLPLLQSDSSRRRAEAALRVLVVDDDMRIADTIAEVLQQAGFEAQAAYAGESALQAAASFRPDCLLSDVLMPKMNGVELAVTFREQHPTARVVLISGQVGISEIIEDAERRGLHFQLLPKPLHPRILIEELRKPSEG
ncbi:MAG TPA: response regulator [Acidobacteriaceae bacterium]|nr:response regulator [Acidobacteriaceae bacterium]